jgi:DNA polymerase elongation subunit (family B)
MLEHLTTERLKNKKLAKETGERSYKDLEGAQKIIINSIYGLLGAVVNFNSPKNAALVTNHGREILRKAIDFATNKGFKLINADTDSISISDDKPWPEERQSTFLSELNSIYPSKIRWENDGLYPRVLVVKAKNYSLIGEKGQTLKGSALKATLKEPALKEFIQEVIDALTHKRPEQVPSIYQKYVREILNLTDINRWSMKKTVTASVLSSNRTNEAKVRDALEGSEYALGDKIYLYFDTNDNLKLASKWNHDHDPIRLLEKLYSTLLVFESVYNCKDCLNYSLKKNQKILPVFDNADNAR